MSLMNEGHTCSPSRNLVCARLRFPNHIIDDKSKAQLKSQTLCLAALQTENSSRTSHCLYLPQQLYHILINSTRNSFVLLLIIVDLCQEVVKQIWNEHIEFIEQTIRTERFATCEIDHLPYFNIRYRLFAEPQLPRAETGHPGTNSVRYCCHSITLPKQLHVVQLENSTYSLIKSSMRSSRSIKGLIMNVLPR